MKTLLSLLVISIFFAMSCKNTETKNVVSNEISKVNLPIKKSTDKKGKAYRAKFICPMHCKGSGSLTAGKCPVCKMDLVANQREAHDDHKGHNHHEGHDHDHEGHSH